MTTSHSFSDRALSLLDSLWHSDTHMGVIRKKLHTLTGINYTEQEVRDTATRWEQKGARNLVTPQRIVVPPVIEEARPVWRMEREVVVRYPDKVALKPKGSHPVPVGGFSMLRRK